MTVLGGSAVLDRGRPDADPFEGFDRAQALSEVSRYCDIEERLSLVPPSAKVRGTYCRSIDAALSEAGMYRRYRELFPQEVGTLQWLPCSEFLTRLVLAGALLKGSAQVTEGMLEIGRRNALEFARSLLGRILLRLLSRDPKKLLLQGVAARRQTCSYGEWQVTFPSEHSAIVTMTEEYLYIESFMFGAALGTFHAVDAQVEARAELSTKFDGRHLLNW